MGNSRIGYCIVDPNGNIVISSFDFRRKDCIDLYVGNTKWIEWKKQGWQCKKAKLTIDICK